MFNLAPVPAATWRGEPVRRRAIAPAAAMPTIDAMATRRRERRDFGAGGRGSPAVRGRLFAVVGRLDDVVEARRGLSAPEIVGACGGRDSRASSGAASSGGAGSVGGGVALPNGTRSSRGPSQSRGRRITLSDDSAVRPASI